MWKFPAQLLKYLLQFAMLTKALFRFYALPGNADRNELHSSEVISASFVDWFTAGDCSLDLLSEWCDASRCG